MGGHRVPSDVRLDGQTAIVTGANAGIGLETARGLYERGARVLLAVRSVSRGEAARAQLERQAAGAAPPAGSLHVMQLDLASLASVRAFAERINREEARLDLLINNACLILAERSETQDGFETTFGVNHLGHFLLTMLLLDKLKASAPARVIVLSSVAHERGQILFDDLQLTRGYELWKAYSQSKLANVLFARELSRRLHGTGVTVYAVHPGVVRTPIWANAPAWQRCFLVFLKPFFKSAASGAETSLFCAMSPKVATESGKYYVDCKAKEVAPAARKDADAARLWEISEKLVGLTSQ
ncbi:retinol dehydrogenase 12-like [Amphibalanus amphitrite]|uniref:retinol dehydrogenase 12-like n=1 Tax=Amphibalanus amphitrite TaxID=1232801 RepID=UPI001C8FCA2E|nr:retinol dehydrogenase 12-like [Amphibalanus amphitrite]